MENKNKVMNNIKGYDYSGFWGNYKTNLMNSFRGMKDMIVDLFSYGKGYIVIGLLVVIGFVISIITTIISTYFVTLYTRRKTIEITQKEKG